MHQIPGSGAACAGRLVWYSPAHNATATNMFQAMATSHWEEVAHCPLWVKSGHGRARRDVCFVPKADMKGLYSMTSPAITGPTISWGQTDASANVQSLGGHRRRNARPGWARHRLPPLLDAEVACDHVGGIVPRAAGDRPPGVAASAAQVQSFNRRAVAAQVRSRPIAAKLRRHIGADMVAAAHHVDAMALDVERREHRTRDHVLYRQIGRELAPL